MKTMSLIAKKRSIRRRFLNSADAGIEMDSRGAERGDIHRSRNAEQLSSYTPRRKARTILVPVDFSESSNRALDYALSLAEALHASIVLLHVINPMYAEGFLDAPAKRNLRTETHRVARKKLDALVELQSNCFASIRCVVRSGVPEHEILRLADSMDVDLIVLGRQLRSLLIRLIFGSVTRHVVDLAPCPVVVVPTRGTERGLALFLGEHQVSKKMR